MIRIDTGDLETQADQILSDFSDFTHGTRVLLLLHRHKEGGSTNEYKRRRARFVTHTPEQLKSALLQMLILQATSDLDYRIYMSSGPRDLRRAELHFKTDLLQNDFCEGGNKESFWKNLEDKWLSALMATRPPKGEQLFVIDRDDKDSWPLEFWCQQNNIDVVKVYKTKNGWHFVVKPFNATMFPKELGEIKKDGLLLLAY